MGGLDTVHGNGLTGISFEHASGNVEINLQQDYANGGYGPSATSSAALYGVTSAIGSPFDDMIIGNGGASSMVAPATTRLRATPRSIRNT